jgi:hypothetical protein
MGGPSSIFDMLSSGKHFFDLDDGCHFFFNLPLFLGFLQYGTNFFNCLLGLLQIFSSQFEVDDFHISDWIKFTFGMSDIFIWEPSDNMIDTIDCRNMG